MMTATSNLQYWRGSAPSTGQPQEFETYGSYSVSVFKLAAVPDFASGHFKLLEHLDPSARVGFVASLQKSLLKSLAYFSYSQLGRGMEISCGYSLRIIYQPSSSGAVADVSTDIYLLARVASNDSQQLAAVANKQKEYIATSLRTQLYKFEENTEHKFDWLPSWLHGSPTPACYEILKPEEIFQWLDADDQPRQNYFYSPGTFQVNKGNNMVGLLEQLQGYRQPVCLDITLVPTRVEGYEKKTISRYLEALTTIAKGVREEEIDPDSNTQKAKSVYEDIKKRYYSGIVFLYSFRVFSPSEDTCESVANQLAAAGTANAVSPQVIPVPDRKYAVQTAQQVNINDRTGVPGMWDSSGKILRGFPGGPGMLMRLHRLVDLDEAAAFFRFPIPLNQPCPGVAYDMGTATVGQEKLPRQTIKIGKYYLNRLTDKVCEFDIQELKKHLLIVGGSGSGKTMTTRYLLTQLWEKHRIPFMVFDPKLTPEYRYLKRLPAFKDDLLIFTPGIEDMAPLRMNPFDVMPGIRLQEHISRIFDCFMGALPLENPLPSFIQEAIDYLYQKKGWNLALDKGGKVGRDGEILAQPTMLELYEKVLDLAPRNYGSDKEVGDRIKGALKARLYTLVSDRGTGSMLMAGRPLPLGTLMRKPVIFELGGLNQEEQALFSLFILVFVVEYIRTARVNQFQPQRQGESANDIDLRHVILVEEAHNLLGKVETTGEEANSKSEVVDKFAQIMREMRATGEGVVVVDQSPAALAQSIVDATNLKVMLRLPSPDDRDYLGRAIGLTEGEAQLSGRFSPGECFYYIPGWDTAKRVATDNFEQQPGVPENLQLHIPFTDDILCQQMREFMQQDIAAQIAGFQATIKRLSEEINKLEEKCQPEILAAEKDAYKEQIKQKNL
ncbi:MAG: hypothetical protein Fur0025_47820 [Oscillatoriaceae cyanobacterium]